MKKIVKHILYTLIMLLMLLGISQFQNTGYDSVIMPIIWGLIFIILIATGIYLYHGHKKGTFTFILMFVLSFSLAAVAQVENRTPSGANAGATSPPNSNQSIMEQLRSIKDNWEDKFCEYEDDFDPDDAVEDPSLFTEDIQQACLYANRYMDTYRKALERGLIEEGIIFDTEWEDTKDCAEDLLELQGEYEVLRAEKTMGTVLQILESENNSCWPCGLTSLMLMAVENVVIEMEDNLKAAALDMLGVMFLFWILFKVLMLIGKFGTSSNSEFFTEFLVRSIFVIICAAILSLPLAPRSGNDEDNTGFYSYTLSPMISFTAGLSKAFVTIDTSSANPRLDMGAELPSQPDGDSFSNQLIGRRANALLACSCCQTGSRSDCNGGSVQNGAILDAESKRELLCMTCSVYKQTAPLIAVGRIMMYRSVVASSTLGKLARWAAGVVGSVIGGGAGALLSVVPFPFGMWVIGLVLIVAFSWLSFTVATKIFDIFIRIGFVFLLAPFLIATCAFPLTRQYTKRGWDFLMHSLLCLVGLSIGMALTLAIFRSSFPDVVMRRLSELMQVTEVYNNYASDLYEAFSKGGGAFYTVFIMLIICLFGVKIINSSQKVVEALSGLTAGIPSICGAAIMGIIKGALAVLKLAKAFGTSATEDIQDKIKNKGGENDKSKDSAKSNSRLKRFLNGESGDGKSSGSGGGGSGGGGSGGGDSGGGGSGGASSGGASAATNAAGDAVEKSANTAAKAVEQGTEATGNAIDKAGSSLGNSISNSGRGLCATGYGAIAGVPLIILGGTITASSKIAAASVKATGKAAAAALRASGKAASKAIKASGKAADKAVKTGGRSAAKGIDKGRKGLENGKTNMPHTENANANSDENMNKLGDKLKQQPGKSKKSGSNNNADNKHEQPPQSDDEQRPLNKKRREQAGDKYSSKRKSLDKLEGVLDAAVEAGDSSVGENR